MNGLKCLLLFFIILIPFHNISSQTTTIISNLHDTLQPKTTYLKDTPPPKTKIATNPTVITFANNIAQGKGNFTTYNSDDGLAMDAINYGHKSSICDREGNIWFGTQGGGVSKYDGKSFINYTAEQGLANNSVRSIAEDKSGNLWFGTNGGGLSKYDGKSFITYTTKQGLANNYVFSIAEDKSGNLWFGTQGGGVSKYDGKSFITYTTEQGLANNSVRSIAEDKSGNLWFGTDGGGVSKYDGESFTSYSVEQGLANNSVYSVAEDKSGNLWFGTQGGGVSKYDGNFFIPYTTEQGLANNYVFSIAEDKSGNLWFGTSGGVSKYDGNFFITYTTEHGLANSSVFSITEDKSGNLWFGTSGGVSKYDGESFISFTVEQGLANNNVRSIAEDKSGNLWFGTNGGGVSKYDGESFTNYTIEQGLANNTVFSIAEDKSGNLWFGTYGGVSKYDGEYFMSYTVEQGLANNTVFSIAEDKSGNLWFGTYGGVSKYDGESFTSYTIEQGLANNNVNSIAEDKSGNLWFGTNGGGVSKYDGKSFITYTTEQGLANNYVYSIAEDKSGNLWFGTYGGGVNVLRAEEREKLQDKKENVNTTKEVFFTYTTKDGLSDNVIMGIKETKEGNIILGTNFGLSVLTGLSNKSIAQGNKPVVEVYNQFTGYPVRDVNGGGNNNGAMCYDRNGILWVGNGSNGLTRVDLDAINKSSSVPNVVINKVSLKGEAVCFYSLNNTDNTTLAQQEVATYGKVLSQAERGTLQQRFAGIEFDGITKFYPLPKNLVLPYEHNALTFEFNAIETGCNFMVNYQFMLKGMDNEWSPVTKKREATYNNLSEGNYIFLLKAQSPSGLWSEPVAFTFTVLPPWHRTWWAYGGYAVLIVLSIWGLIKMQTRVLKKRQEELEYEVKIATVEIRSQKEQIEEAHKEITDSINYAERIQRSFLATDELLNNNLKDYFVFFQPKDVVSGDFYWAGKLNNGNFAMVNADSTGHGVPGAIMSILNISSIERSIENGAIDPSQIFNDTRKSIIERLKKDGSEEGGKDGMDASIICFDFENNKFTYTAAQNPIWVIRGGELIEIKPEKMPIGKHDKDSIPFVGGEFEIQKGDQIYTLTDGFQDQFGGPKGKKFMVKKMREYLLSISNLTMEEQHQKIKEAFVKWKGKIEQIDDVCVIGVRV
jgi:ligand-binding sensor domain-containing protein/serine phosphatase RsbU (regulator of sigma subunit)